MTTRIHVISQREGNNCCADCASCAPPEWAILNFGVFVCIHCSGVHRSFGTHISQVRSLQLDTFTDEMCDVFDSLGNKDANSFWQFHVVGFEIPKVHDPYEMRERFIRAKYVFKEFIPRCVVDIPRGQLVYQKVEKKGFLTKQGGSHQTWKRRWFLLNDHMMKYFKSQSDSYPIDSLSVEEDTMVDFVLDEDDTERKFCFSIMTPDNPRKYLMQADTQQELVDWVFALRASKHYSSKKERRGMTVESGDSVLKEGYMTKQGGKHKSWKKRYFRLRNGKLSYYKKPQNPEALGDIPLADATVEWADSLDVKKDNCIVVYTDNRTYYFCGCSREEMTSWRKAIAETSGNDDDEYEVRVDLDGVSEEANITDTSTEKACDATCVRSWLERRNVYLRSKGSKIGVMRRSIKLPFDRNVGTSILSGGMDFKHLNAEVAMELSQNEIIK